MALLALKDNIPFWPHKEVGAFNSIEGTLNIYHSEVAENGEALGPRTFLFQMLEGELFLPLKPHTREDGVIVGLLAVPVRDCELNSASPKLSTAMRPYIEEFIEKCGRRMGRSREFIEGEWKRLNDIGIEGFIEGYMAELDAYVREEKRRAEAANRRRYAGEGVYLHNALTSLQNAVGGKAEKAVIDEGSANAGPVIEACMVVAKDDAQRLDVKTHV